MRIDRARRIKDALTLALLAQTKTAHDGQLLRRHKSHRHCHARSIFHLWSTDRMLGSRPSTSKNEPPGAVMSLQPEQPPTTWLLEWLIASSQLLFLYHFIFLPASSWTWLVAERSADVSWSTLGDFKDYCNCCFFWLILIISSNIASLLIDKKHIP